MGSICSKGISSSKKYGSFDETISVNRGRNSLGKVAPEVEACDIVNKDTSLQSLSVSQNNSNEIDRSERNVNVEKDVETGMEIVDVPNWLPSEHVNSGWPSWLTLVAAEAVSGWLPRREDSFEKLEKIGQGTYSTVYRARDLHNGKPVALKKVRFLNMDPDSVRFMAREINILRRLDHPNVIKLEGIITSKTSCNLYLVFEYMEHDLAGLASIPGIKFTEAQVKCFMQQLLSGLDHCHKNGILHRDIKGSNLLVDKNGVLRIGDFGLATKFNPHKKERLTSHVVTLWYRPPELLLGATEYGAAVDLWSAGCILAELLVGKPIMPGRTEVEQLHKIFKLCGSPAEDYWKKTRISKSTVFRPQQQYPRRVNETFNDFSSPALNLLNILLAIESEGRGTAASALQNEFFTTNPLACDPSSLPKYPSSKEYDTRLRNEEARRQREAAKRKDREKPGKIPNTCSLNNTEEGQGNQPDGKCNSDKYNELGSSTVHTGAYGDMRGKKNKKGDNRPLFAHSATTLKRSHGLRVNSQRSHVPQYMDIRDFASFLGRNNATASTSDMQNMLSRPASSNEPDEDDTDSTTSHEEDTRRIRYSGPLMPAEGNIDDLLKEHERQIQEAARKVRLEKVKTKKNLINEI